MALISAHELSFTYPEAPTPTLTNLSFKVEAGEFTLLCGQTGSGKTTLLRHLVPALTPHGTRSGTIAVNVPVGFVQQDPDNQIVTDLVFHELAFALENQALPTQAIRRRVAETASYFGMEYLLETSTHTLSGGQKQLLNLAAVLVAQPEVLVLDEPTAQLDPIAAQNFLRHLARINRELGTTIICAEHRLDETLDLADKVLLLNSGGAEQLTTYTPKDFVISCQTTNKNFIPYLPEPTQIALAAPSPPKDLPISVNQGRTWLKETTGANTIAQTKTETPALAPTSAPALTLKDLCFRYSKDTPFILKHLTASFTPGKIHAIVGGNASGKSTLLNIIARLEKPQLGKVILPKSTRLAALPQNPKATLIHDTLREDLQSAARTAHAPTPDSNATTDTITQIATQLNLTHLLGRHPYDLSGGETQKAALAKLLLTHPDIILLDEPTTGLDAIAKQEIGTLLAQLATTGKTIIMVTHDLPFAAQHAHTCSLLANTEIIAHAPARDFFTGNSFYTTPTSRMTRNILAHCTTTTDATAALASLAALTTQATNLSTQLEE